MLAKGQGPILIAGQTASGKSGLALKLAQEHDGIIINADSMQVYGELQILTARPGLDEMQDISHRLYGHINASTAYSLGQWLQDVERTLLEIEQVGKRAIIVGGTGLYFKGLLEGLSPVPDIPDDVRDKWRTQALDPAIDLHKQLHALDPAIANQLLPSDRQRLARALEVIEGTGKSLLYWQTQPEKALLDPDKTEKIMISIERAELYKKCDQRFEQMMQNGVLAEVEELLRLNLPPTLPAMRALGVRPLSAFLQGEISKEEAVERAKTETRQYAKRQNTWLKSNMITWNAVNL
ncbi:MAG: tRNA (adenosine(37)-N6)-dimethylallyltransferase MiaA [Hyphomicrobiaceae bacterium]|nr:tRNA (adenosine(37)-N6)-dimethylallyltransferase MiaA [Hyphomicrobiaceae bacterium]